MADITEIKRGLADRAQSVAEHLLPGGRKEGQEWRAGSTSGEKGQSLGVHLSGNKAGVWQDFSSGEGGDLIDLWVETRGVPLTVALDEARTWLGMANPDPARDPRPTYKRPPKPKCSAPQGRVRDYLVEERNIPGHVLDLYKIGENGDEIIFPFLLPGGELALAKVRKAEDGAKPKPTAAECEPVLFGWQAVPEDAREIILTEGEIDALSWMAYGKPAMSLPFGGGKGGKQKWIENDFERMARFEKIYLSTDMDGPGEEAAEEIAGRLGRHRCLRVSLPRKDANQCLMDGVPEAEMLATLRTAASLDPEGLRKPSDFLTEVSNLFWPVHGEKPGYTLPYDRLADKVHFRPSEVTLWSGASGDGKSQIISDCTPHWLKEGSRLCVASLEMPAAQQLRRLVKQTTGLDRPTDKAIGNALQWLDQGMLIYDRIGKAGVRGLLDVFDYARAKYGCDQFVIDSLMRLGVQQEDYDGLEKLVFDIVNWTMEHRVHVHLVAHARKPAMGSSSPRTEDIKGPMEIGANAANIITIWRNRTHDEKVKAAKTDDERLELEKKPPVILNIAKQRHGDYEGKAGLWFEQTTYRYYTSSDHGVWGRTYITSSDLGSVENFV